MIEDAEPLAPDVSAHPPCDRCGTFAELVDYDGHQICEDCIGRLSEIERTPPTVGNVLSGSLWVLGQIALPAAVIVVLADLPVALIDTFIPELPFVSTAWNATVTVLAQGAVFHLAHRAIRGDELDPMTALRRSVDSAGNLIITNFLAGLQIFFFTLLLIVPGVVRSLSLLLVIPVVLHEGEKTSDALRASTERMNGHRLTALVVNLVWSVVWGGALAAYIAFAVALEFPEVGLNLSTGAINAILLAGALVIPVLMLPVTCVTAVFYAKTLKYRVV